MKGQDMENTPLDQEEPSNTKPTSPGPTPSSLKPPSETWQQHHPVLMFLMGVGIGLLSLLVAQGLNISTQGNFPGCVLPALGLLLSPPFLAFKSQRLLGVGLLVGFLIAVPVSLFLWVGVACGPGPGC